jgi:hypothetical protein
LGVHGGPGEFAAEAVEGIGETKMSGDDGIVAVVHQH